MSFDDFCAKTTINSRSALLHIVTELGQWRFLQTADNKVQNIQNRFKRKMSFDYSCAKTTINSRSALLHIVTELGQWRFLQTSDNKSKTYKNRFG